MAARRSTIPGRKHKMVFVDFSHPYLREYLTGYCALHRARLLDVADKLADWAAQARAADVAAGIEPRPLAAVFDIDEVLLCNFHMNSFRGEQGATAIDFHAADFFTRPDGTPWLRGDSRLNPLYPGARALLERATALGIQLFLLTGRLESIRDETVENLVYVGLAGEGGTGAVFRVDELASRLIMCPDAEYPPAGQSVRPFKESRRRAIDKTHHIVVNVGDQISDLGLYGFAQVHCSHPFYWTP